MGLWDIDFMARELKHFLNSVIQPNDDWRLNLLNSWPDIMGNLVHKVRLEKINNDSLILGVYESCWLQELYLLSPILLNAINQKLDQPRIKHLRFKRAAPLKKYVSQKYDTQLPTTVDVSSITLTQKEENALAQIQDEQLKDALKKFLIRCYREKVDEKKCSKKPSLPQSHNRYGPDAFGKS